MTDIKIRFNHLLRLKRALTSLFRLLIWANRRRYGEDALNFLKAESPIDNLDCSDMDDNGIYADINRS